MKKYLLLIPLVVLIVSCSTYDKNRYAGTKTLYQYHNVKHTKPPQGYKPFYVDYTGRHGSRYMGDPTERAVAEVLQKAKDKDLLTEKGQQLLGQAKRFTEVNQGNYGLLTDVGKKELEGIGRRMLTKYPEVFKGNHIVMVLTTDQERTKQSAQSFLVPYSSTYSEVKIAQEPKDSQATLRFFDLSPAYNTYRKSSYVTAVVDTIRKSEENEMRVKNVLARIFEQDFIDELTAEVMLADGSKYDSSKLAMSIYDLYTAPLSLPDATIKGFDLDFSGYFTLEEKAWFDRAVSCRSYMTLGPAFDVNGIQIKVASPLLISILSTADSAATNQTIDAYLKFGHAETTTPLVTLLGIEGANKSASSINQFDTYWSAEEVASMATNIQLIFYKHEDVSKPVLVKVLLNEKEVRVPVETTTFPYYKWDDFKSYYYKKLEGLGISIGKEPLELLSTMN